MAATESYPDELKYHREHDWARVEGDVATFGITWYAQDALGDIVVYLPPEVGQRVTAGEEYGELGMTRWASQVAEVMVAR